jgi:hypothetical protein
MGLSPVEAGSGMGLAPVEAFNAVSRSLFSAAKNSPPERLKQLRRPLSGVPEKTEPLRAKPPHGRCAPSPSPIQSGLHLLGAFPKATGRAQADVRRLSPLPGRPTTRQPFSFFSPSEGRERADRKGTQRPSGGLAVNGSVFSGTPARPGRRSCLSLSGGEFFAADKMERLAALRTSGEQVLSDPPASVRSLHGSKPHPRAKRLGE